MDYFIRWPAQIEYKSLGSPDFFNGGVLYVHVEKRTKSTRSGDNF